MLTEKKLFERDAKRNIGEELLQAIRDVKARRYGDIYEVKPSELAVTRQHCGLPQAQVESFCLIRTSLISS